MCIRDSKTAGTYQSTPGLFDIQLNDYIIAAQSGVVAQVTASSVYQDPTTQEFIGQVNIHQDHHSLDYYSTELHHRHIQTLFLTISLTLRLTLLISQITIHHSMKTSLLMNRLIIM